MTESNHGGKRIGAGRKSVAPIVRRSMAIRVDDMAKLSSIAESPTLALRRLIEMYDDLSRRLEAMTAELQQVKAENTALKAIKADRRNVALKAMENIGKPITTPTVEPTRRKTQRPLGVGEYDPTYEE